MNQVLIVSDSHGLTHELIDIQNRHKPTYMIHCGDSQLEFESQELKGYIKVGGNCDFYPDYPNEEIVTIGGLNFFITHGHLHNVKMNLTNLSYRAEEEGADVICFGHTHIAGAEKINQQLFINPGSIRMPRNRKEKTYAMMSWENKENIQVTFYSLDGEVVEQLNYQTSMD